MGFLLFIIVLFIICVGGGRLLGKAAGNALFPDKKEDKYTFIDKSVHHHHHHHEHKNISIIDDETKKKILELKESNDGK
jgi:hypothetical protein